ncbi:MAG: hypothetical protein ACTSRU_06975 [Candidatus Hodarchaeales archaeon]
MKKMAENCHKCGEEIDSKTRVISEIVDKRTGGVTKVTICFTCFKKEKARSMKFFAYSGMITIVLGIFTFLIADELVYYAGLPQLYGLPRTHDAYWVSGFLLVVIGVIVVILGYKKYHKILRLKSKIELFK